MSESTRRAAAGRSIPIDVFISYRREEASYLAGWLHEYLAERLGRERIFLDIDGIRPGIDFMQVITAVITQARVMLVLIGPRWLTDASGVNRLLDPLDPVRVELRAALAAGLFVIPVLFDGTRMPPRRNLPADVAGLADLEAATLTYKTFHTDAEELLRSFVHLVRGGPRPTPSAHPFGNAAPSWPPSGTQTHLIDDEQGELLLAKLEEVYAEYLRQAVDDPRILAVPLRLRPAPGKTWLPTDALLPRGRRSDEPIDENDTLLSVFDRSGAHHGDGLLVLGEAGSGRAPCSSSSPASCSNGPASTPLRRSRSTCRYARGRCTGSRWSNGSARS